MIDKNILLSFFSGLYFCGGLISSCLKFEIRDLWIGMYWNVYTDLEGGQNLTIYICIVPMFPIIIEYFPLKKGDYNGQGKTKV